MRLFALIVVLLVLSPAASQAGTTLRLAPPRSPLPEDIALGLPSAGIEVVDASDMDASAFPINSRRAVHLATRNFGGFAHRYRSGWVRVGRVTVHLVRVLQSNSRGPLGLFPDQIVWLVVIRDVTVPLLGAHSPPWYDVGTMAVFVRTDVPRYVVASTF
jgi:hypothetical protein